MALAIIVTLEKELPDAMAAYTKAKAGKALARESDKLDTVVRRKNVPAITSMLSESQAALIEQLRADGFRPIENALAARTMVPRFGWSKDGPRASRIRRCKSERFQAAESDSARPEGERNPAR